MGATYSNEIKEIIEGEYNDLTNRLNLRKELDEEFKEVFSNEYYDGTTFYLHIQVLPDTWECQLSYLDPLAYGFSEKIIAKKTLTHRCDFLGCGKLGYEKTSGKSKGKMYCHRHMLKMQELKNLNKNKEEIKEFNVPL